jgi:hypothetical protein
VVTCTLCLSEFKMLKFMVLNAPIIRGLEAYGVYFVNFLFICPQDLKLI